MFRNKRGFTLVELLVVAAIIGVLAAMGSVAYVKFSTRSKTRYRTVYLSTAFMAERTFFAEHLSYTLCLRQIRGLPGEFGVTPENALRYYYVGFANQGAPATCGKASNQSCLDYAFGSSALLCNCPAVPAKGFTDCAADANVTAANAAAATQVWSASRTTFKIGTAGFIGGPQADIHFIDETKQITRVQSGE